MPSAVTELHAQWSGLKDVTRLAAVRGPWGALLWDAEKGEYALATDSIGVQPVFWALTGQGDVVAGSWLAQLVSQSDVPGDLDYEAILMSAVPLAMGDAVRHRTRFAAVQQVPWGRVRTFSADGQGGYLRYWDPSSIDELDISSAQASRFLRSVIHQAVERSLNDQAPTGAHISGGLDCSAVALKAQEILQARGESLVAGYSWAPSPAVFDLVENDERPRALAVAEVAGVPMRWVDDNDIGDWYLMRDVNAYPHVTNRWERSVLPQAKDDGVGVILSGWGGDELASFNGRSAVTDLLRRGQVAKAWAMAGANPLRGHGRQRLAGLKYFFDSARRSVPTRGRLSRQRRNVAEAVALLRSESKLAADMVEASWDRQHSLRTVRATQLELFTQGHIQERTMAWYQTGRLFDIRYRYPLLDHDVVTAALALPPEVYRSADWSRQVFRDAVAPWVPGGVVWHRPKFEPAMLHPQSPRRARSTKRPGGVDERSVEVLALASRVARIIRNDGPR